MYTDFLSSKGIIRGVGGIGVGIANKNFILRIITVPHSPLKMDEITGTNATGY